MWASAGNAIRGFQRPTPDDGLQPNSRTITKALRHENETGGTVTRPGPGSVLQPET